MKENFHPQPENPKQHVPEAGAGPLGLPPPSPEQTAQGEGSKSPERQPQQINPPKEPIPLLDPIARILGESLEREYPNPEDRLRYIQRLAAMRPSPQLDALMRSAGIPREQLSPDAEAILRIFGPAYDKPANDKR
jgi:hypothetical protein